MKFRVKFVLITLATLVAVGVTARLGFWQLSRAAEKQSRQALLEAQLSKTPIDAAALLAAVEPKSLLYQRARLRGTWVPQSLTFLENRPMDGRVGFVVVTVLRLESGGALVVQRGWVPRGFTDRTALPNVDTPAGVVEIEGKMAMPPSDLYALGTATTGRIRQNLDLAQFSTETGFPLLPLTLQQTGPNGDSMLRDWPAVNLGIEKNYGYAVQWFGLALLLTLLYGWFQIVRRFIYRPKKAPTDV